LEIVSQTSSDVHKKDVPGAGHSLKKSASDYLEFVKNNLEQVTNRAYRTTVVPQVHCP